MDTCTQETILRAINVLASAIRREIFREDIPALCTDAEFCKRMVAAITVASEAYLVHSKNQEGNSSV